MLRSGIEPWIGLAFCGGVVIAWAWERLVPNPEGPQAFAPDWLPLVAAGVAAAAIVPLAGSERWRRPQRALCWTALLLMIWAAAAPADPTMRTFFCIGRPTPSRLSPAN